MTYARHALSAALIVCLMTPVLHAQYKSEYRVFQIKVDNTEAGTYTQTITTYGEGTTDMVGKSDLKLKVLGITYQQAYRGQERWKDGKLLHLSSASNDNGTTHTLLVNADRGRLQVKEGGKERTANADAWSSSYWTLPSAEQRSKASYLIDADSGMEYQVTWQNMGKDMLIVAGQRVSCTHYKVTGNNLTTPGTNLTADVWFDENDRLVKRQGPRKGKTITLQLVSATVR